MNREEYRKYLLTEHWKQLRAKALDRDGNKCCQCSNSQQLQVHHKIYRATPFDAILEDLQTLCERCHAGVHGKKTKKIRPKKLGAKIEVFGRFFTVNSAGAVAIIEFLSPETPETKAGIHYRAVWNPKYATQETRKVSGLR